MTIKTDALRRSLMTTSRISGIGPLAMAMSVVVVLALALIALLLWENQVTRSRALADARLAVYHESRILGESAAKTMEIAALALAHLAGEIQAGGPAPLPGAEAMDRLLRASQPWFPPLTGLTVHDAAGRRVAADGPAESAEAVADQSFFKDHRDGGLAFLVGAETGRAALHVSRRLATADGGFAGVVSAVVDPIAFDIARDFDVTRRVDGALLVLHSGRVLTAWPSPASATTADDLAGLPLFAGLPTSALAATGVNVVDTDRAIVALTPIRNAPLLAAVAVSRDRILTQWHSQSWQVFAVVIAIAAAIGLVGLGLGHLQARRRGEIERTLKVMSRALEDSPVMVLIASPDGRVEYVNRKLESVSGFRREEIIGQTPGLLVPEDPPPPACEAIRRATLDGKEWSGIVANRKKNGEPYWASLSVSPIRDIKGRIVNFVGVAEDVTDRVEDERHLRQVEKAEALDNLAGGVAHEFNNMLMPIVGLTGEMIKKAPEGSQERRMLEMVLRAAHRARDLVKRILVFSSGAPDRWRPQDISRLLEQCLAAAAPLVPPEIRVHSAIPPDIGRVNADFSQIEAAVINLVSNAVHAMRGGAGEIGVSLERVIPEDPAVRMPPGLRFVPHALIRVSDSGRGIAPEIRPRIFDPFFTTEEVGGGSGLGLSIVHGIVTAHGGAVTVDSTVGAGTTFSLFLPLVDAAAEAEPALIEDDDDAA